MLTFMFSVGVMYADTTSCRVYGSSNDNVAFLPNPKVTAMKDGTLYVPVKLSKAAAEDVAIVVEIKDWKGTLVCQTVVHISKGTTEWGSNPSCDLKAGATYKLSIAKASCSK